MNELRFAARLGGKGRDMLSACSSREVGTAPRSAVSRFPGLKRYAVMSSFLRAGSIGLMTAESPGDFEDFSDQLVLPAENTGQRA